MTTTKKTALLSHIDGDGLGCILLGTVFQETLGIDEFFCKNYDFETEEPEFVEYLKSFDRVLMTDLTAAPEFFEEVESAGTEFFIFDHHDQTSWITERAGSSWDKSRCGTRIFWEDFIKPKVGRYPPLINHYVRLVDTYDLWKSDSEEWAEAKRLNSVFYGFRNWSADTPVEQAQPFLSLMRTKFAKLREWRWTDREKKVIERAEKKEKEAFRLARSNLKKRADEQGRKFGVCRISSKISTVAHWVLEEETDLDYLIIINDFWKARGKLSFRSAREDLNLNSFEGVNGHASAAGATLTENEVERFWSDPTACFREDPDFEG